MINEVINHMTDDELRNYVKHQDELVEAENQLNSYGRELNFLWKQIAISTQLYNDCLLKRDKKLDKLQSIEKELCKKYEEFIPRPIF